MRVLGSDYFRQLDGLSYDEVIRAVDPTGGQRYRAEYYYTRGGGGGAPAWSSPEPSSKWPDSFGRLQY
jgi:hypothetical protein